MTRSQPDAAPASPGAGTGDDTVAALQALLAAEHAAAWAWRVAGARLAGPSRDLAREAVAAHLARRDRLRALLLDRGVAPVAAAAAYDVDGGPGDAAAALALGLRVEEAVAAAQVRGLALLGDPALRAALLAALTAAAVRGARVRALADPAAPATVPFPGAAGLPRPLPPSPPAPPEPGTTPGPSTTPGPAPGTGPTGG